MLFAPGVLGTVPLPTLGARDLQQPRTFGDGRLLVLSSSKKEGEYLQTHFLIRANMAENQRKVLPIP